MNRKRKLLLAGLACTVVLAWLLTVWAGGTAPGPAVTQPASMAKQPPAEPPKYPYWLEPRHELKVTPEPGWIKIIISGVVRDDTGRPVDGAVIEYDASLFDRYPSQAGRADEFPELAKPDFHPVGKSNTGRYRFSLALAVERSVTNLRIRLRAGSVPGVACEAEELRVHTGMWVQDMDFVVPRPCELRGALVSDSGRPLRGARVTCLSLKRGFRRVGRTGSQGRFEFNRLPPDVYALQFDEGLELTGRPKLYFLESGERLQLPKALVARELEGK